MLGWLLKKKTSPSAEKSARAAAEDAPRPDRLKTVKAADSPGIDWPLKLQAALGDDAALRALAGAGGPIDVKLAAVGAITSEAQLRLAERELREHDRRVHRLAKQRHLALVAQREARERAAQLLASAQALVLEPLIPTNRLVALDSAWQALDAALLEPAQCADFVALRAQLTALTHERGDSALRVERWAATARAALASLEAAAAAAAIGEPAGRSDLAVASTAARAVFDAAPEGDASAALREALGDALHGAAQLEVHLAVLDESLLGASTGELLGRWQQLAPLADARLGHALNRRFEDWRHAHDQARQSRRAAQSEQSRGQQRELLTERTAALAIALERAEAALAAGHLADTNRHLVDIDEMLHGGASADELGPRIDQLQSEYATLKGWQHWGGGLARDELVLQAEALASATIVQSDAGGVKLSIRQRAEVIDDMRARWKELDRLGGATSRSLWQRFDAALKTAYEPVAAQAAAQRAAREQNLQARVQLLETLDLVPLPVPSEGAAVPDWRSVAAALDQFHSAWRRLGPVEHTVAHRERDGLVDRLGAAVARLEVPLHLAQRDAQLGREQLIARAKALQSEASASSNGREMVNRVRELQAEWQQHARALAPLPHAIERALWLEFKQEIDALFSARDAVFSAREAEFRAHGAERAALIARLEAVHADMPATEIKRTLGEVDSQWQRAGPALRSDAATLDARFRNARDSAQRWLAGSAQRSWHATCDALVAKLALCEALEASPDTAVAKAELAQRWSEWPALPSAWERALTERASLTLAEAGEAPGRAVSSDTVLLQLEEALQLSSPATFQAARRELKLQAMKAALESRQSGAVTPLAPDQWLAVALGRTSLDDLQRERLTAVIAAFRSRGATSAG